jgi:hypothetical protein
MSMFLAIILLSLMAFVCGSARADDLLSTTPPSISLETAQTILGRGPAEVSRITKMLENTKLWMKPQQESLLEGDISDGRALPVPGRESQGGSASNSE